MSNIPAENKESKVGLDLPDGNIKNPSASPKPPLYKEKGKNFSLPRMLKTSNENLIKDNDNLSIPQSRSYNQLSQTGSPRVNHQRVMHELQKSRTPLSPTATGDSLDKNTSPSLEILTLSEEPLSDDDDDDETWDIKLGATRV